MIKSEFEESKIKVLDVLLKEMDKLKELVKERGKFEAAHYVKVCWSKRRIVKVIFAFYQMDASCAYFCLPILFSCFLG